MSSESKKRVAKGAGQAILGRLGAAIEALSIIFFTWAYGVEAFGLYAVLWSWTKLLAGLCELAMPNMLQRYVPREDIDQASRTVGLALKLSGLLALISAALIYAAAPLIADLLNTGAQAKTNLSEAIRLYVWVLPLWVFVDVGTAASRATRIFGPEVRVRVFYEQFFRLFVAALIFLLASQQTGALKTLLLTYGLLVAHMSSVAIAAALTLRLVLRAYHGSAIINAQIFADQTREKILYCLALLPATLTKRLFSELPVVMLNLWLAGASGAAAAAYYAIARKVASVLQLVRIAFDYVMAPLAAEKDGAGDTAELARMARFSTRLAVIFGLPLFAAMAMILPMLFKSLPAAMSAAIPATIILMGGRFLELCGGPSQSLIEVLGRPLWPALNAAFGLVCMSALGFVFIPQYGASGAALAAAIGLNITSLCALLQARYKLNLRYHGGLFWRYLSFGALAATPAFTLSAYQLFTPPLAAATALPILALSCLVLLKVGLSESDAAALGHIGKRHRDD